MARANLVDETPAEMREMVLDTATAILADMSPGGWLALATLTERHVHGHLSFAAWRTSVDAIVAGGAAIQGQRFGHAQWRPKAANDDR